MHCVLFTTDVVSGLVIFSLEMTSLNKKESPLGYSQRTIFCLNYFLLYKPINAAVPMMLLYKTYQHTPHTTNVFPIYT